MNTRSDRTIVRAVRAALCLGLLSVPSLAGAQKPPAPGGLSLVTVGAQKMRLTGIVSKGVLRKLVFTSLIRQAAVKAGVMPTDKDVDARVRELSVRQPALAQQAANPSVRADLRTDIALENLRTRNVTVSNAQVTSFYTHHAALYTKPSQVQTTMVVSNKRSDAGRAETLLGQGATPQAISAMPGLNVAGLNGYNLNMGALPAESRQMIGKTVLAMKPGQIKTISIPGGTFLTFKVKNAHGDELLPLSQVKDEVTRQAKLQKAVSPQQELANLYRTSPPRFSDPKYKAYFSDVEHYHAQR